MKGYICLALEEISINCTLKVAEFAPEAFVHVSIYISPTVPDKDTSFMSCYVINTLSSSDGELTVVAFGGAFQR